MISKTIDKLLDISINIKYLLILSNVLLVFFLILLSNLEVLPVKNTGNFLFFVFLLLLLALYRPGWIFLFFVGTIAIENINLAPSEIGINVRPYQLLAALSIISILIRFFAKRLSFELPKLRAIDLIPFLFVLSSFISALFSQNKPESFKLSLVVLSFAVIYYLTRVFVQNLEDIKKIITFFLSSSAIIVVYGIWQNTRFALGLNSFEIMPGRPNATFAEPDWLGTFLVFLLAALYAIIYYFNETENNTDQKVSISNFNILEFFSIYKNQIIKWFVFLLLTICYSLIIITVSRSAWLGVLIVSVAYFLFCFGCCFINLKKRIIFYKIWTMIISAGFLGVAIVYFFNLTNFQLFDRAGSIGTGLQKITISCESKEKIPKKIDVNEDILRHGCRHINLEEIETEKQKGHHIEEVYRRDPNIAIRSDIYQKSLIEIKSSPFFGIGWGSIANVLGKDARGSGLNSSNIFLEVWLGSGFLGLLSFLFAWFYILYTQAKKIKSFLENCGENKTLQKTASLFIILAWLSLTTTNLFNAGIFIGVLWLFIGVSQFKYENRN